MDLDLFQFTCQLIEIDSTSGREASVGEFVAATLRHIGDFNVELWPVEPGRFNVFACADRPRIVFSTHLDTVPPFIPCSEDAQFIYGRGACDAKGILAAQLFAARDLVRQGMRDVGLLFVVGEEKNSAGAKSANLRPVGSRFLINGEPTEGRLVTGGKGTLRVDIRCRGQMAHSAYPELGSSAIEKMVDALMALRRISLPEHALLGKTTYNVGTITGGRAPNVVPDWASCEILFRTVEDSFPLRRAITSNLGESAEADFVLDIPPVFLRQLKGFESDVVAFTTDIPNLSAWGEPFLMGPGSISVAHTDGERISKIDLTKAVSDYKRIAELL